MTRPVRPKTLVDLATDPVFLGHAALVGPEWAPWRAFLAAVAGLPPEDEAAAALIRRCTGRDVLPTEPAGEVWSLVGRRGGKSRIAAFLAVVLSTKPYRFAPGERGTFIIIAGDRRQARTVLRYIGGYLKASPMLWDFVVKDGKKPRITNEAIELANGVTIEVMTANFRALRGYTVVGAIADEVAFWRSEDSSNPDAEVLGALRPAMATVPDAMLIAITSVYARTGETWRMHQKHFGRFTNRVLVWKAASRDMNPTLPAQVVEDAIERDAAQAAAEYLSEFRTDVEGFLTREAVEAIVEVGCHEREPFPETAYVAFVDPAGGSGGDSMTLAIAHAERGRAVLDLIREERPPFDPEAVTERFVADLKRYRLSRVTGDHYSAEWVRGAFGKRGVVYDVSDLTKSEIYLEALPMVNAHQAVILDHARLTAQLQALERRTGRGGRDSVDHPPNGHDDVANAVAGALRLAGAGAGPAYAAVLEPDAATLRSTYSGDTTAARFGRSRRQWFSSR